VLRLARGVVRSAGAADSREQELTVELADGVHPAIADVALVGACEVGDEVIVNVAARELGLGSGGFDIVHANLTRGLDGTPPGAEHVLKLNYTSLQHAIDPVESRIGAGDPALAGAPVAVIALHGQLGPVAWAFERRAPGARVGFVQTAGGALPGSHSRSVDELLARGLIADHIAAGTAFGGASGDAVTTAGALAFGFAELGWDAAICGPGPGIVGSGTRLGHGGLVALDSAHTALALGAETVIVPRMSSSDQRPEHQGVSHHTRTVLELLLAPVIVALPASEPLPELVGQEHDLRRRGVDLEGYAASGLPDHVMGRSLDDDNAFFAAALAGGVVLGELVAEAD
jgi:hypothetical protein